MFCQSDDFIKLLIYSLVISTSSCSCVKSTLKSVALWSKCDCDRLLEPLCFSCKKIERFITLEVVWVAQLVARHRRCQSKPNPGTSWSTWPCPGQLLIGLICPQFRPLHTNNCHFSSLCHPESLCLFSDELILILLDCLDHWGIVHGGNICVQF